MKNINQNPNENNVPQEPDAFALAVEAAETDQPLYGLLVQHFLFEMHKAIEHGRILAHMTSLYPIFREINRETDETNAYWKSVENRASRRKALEVPNA